VTLTVVVTVGAALMAFEPVRQFGVGLFASAGLAGLVVALAARPIIANVIAGVQIAMTQPIRRMGVDRRHHLHLRRDTSVGLAPVDCAALPFHREAVPELDT
jgi:hypothetical protein